jgi:hypothetical protein
METFYATIKLQTGEEILCVVSETNLEKDYVKIKFPIQVEEIEIPGVIHGLKVKYWLRTSQQDEFIIPADKIVAFTEIKGDAIEFYKNSMMRLEMDDHPKPKRKNQSRTNKRKTDETGRIFIDKDMGLLSSIDDARQILESIFKQDSSNTKDSKDSKDI